MPLYTALATKVHFYLQRTRGRPLTVSASQLVDKMRPSIGLQTAKALNHVTD